MLQNSLERLLEGMAAGLHEVVLPALDDPFARSQVIAVIELLGNLSTRVEWRCADLAAVVDRVREVLAEVARAGAHDPALDPVRAVLAESPGPGPGALSGTGPAAGPASPGTASALASSAAAHLAALGVAQEWAAARPDRADLDRRLRDVVRWQLDGELARLRSAGFGRPT